MAHSFTIEVSDAMTSALAKVASEITGSGGIFQGDEDGGNFSGKTPLGMIKGEYRCVSGRAITITITDKPFMLPYTVIESTIREYFS